jgi:hypothetical protein
MANSYLPCKSGVSFLERPYVCVDLQSEVILDLRSRDKCSNFRWGVGSRKFARGTTEEGVED